MTLLRLENVGKCYRAYKSEFSRFASWFGLPNQVRSESWVLRNINLEVGQGEAIGIVGHNGAGKSTLLRAIAGTLQPSEGSIAVKGRVGAILELGMGFDPELSGEQNAAYAAGLMGFSKNEIEMKMREIAGFADIGHYFTEPLRTYSSGMAMRVAFSVATAWRPDLLIVDEALSVGDHEFSAKCLDRIKAFREQSTSLFLVSHNRAVLDEICDRTIILENGRLLSDSLSSP